MVPKLTVVVSDVDFGVLLGTPTLENETGNSQASAIFELLQEYGIADTVVALCCDTTPSNTGRKNGAAVLLQQLLDQDTLLLPCRHHILELLLRAAFESKFSEITGPNVFMFADFKSKWSTLNISNFSFGINDQNVYELLKDDLNKIRNFIEQNLQIEQVRDDYRELLDLCAIFIRSVPQNDVVFRAPGAMHHAR